MVREIRGYKGRLAALLGGAAVVAVLGGCDIKHESGNLVAGKQLFVAKCGSCHTLSHAGTNGTVGPNLDDAFRQDRADGVKSASINGLVSYWIRTPDSGGVMPAGILAGRQASNVAAYVGRVAAIPGQDSGELAAAVQSVVQKPAVEKAGVLQIDADPTGQLKFLSKTASATPGAVTIKMKNMSSVDHDIAITGNGGPTKVSSIVANGATASITANLTAGTYTFYCSVDGHRAAGMVGTITVK
jgi:plastocyanin